MTNPLPIPDELWAKVPPGAQAAIAAVFLAMEQRVIELETRVGDLEARLKLNSTNSSKPPSSDPIGMKRKPPAPSQREEARRAARTSQGPPRLGPAREGPRDVPLQADRLPPLRSRALRRRPRTLDPSSRRTAQDRADRRRVSAPSPGLSRLRRDDLRHLAPGRPEPGASARTSRPCWPCSRGPIASASGRSSSWPPTCSACRSPPG